MAVNLTDDYLKLSQEVKIVDSLRKYLPHLIDATSSDLLQGKKLDELLDDLKLPPAAERTSKLNAEQKGFSKSSEISSGSSDAQCQR